MMHRFFKILLLFSLVANQGLLLSHAHEGMSEAEAREHAAKPHFHFHTHGHSHSHHAPHEDSEIGGYALASIISVDHPSHAHDFGAVFGSAAEMLVRESDDEAGDSVSLIAFDQLCDDACARSLPQSSSMKTAPGWHPVDACPLYLRTLSLRL